MILNIEIEKFVYLKKLLGKGIGIIKIVSLDDKFREIYMEDNDALDIEDKIWDDLQTRGLLQEDSITEETYLIESLLDQIIEAEDQE